MDAPQRHGIVERAKVEVSSNHRTERGIRMNITTIGIDLAKSVFQIHGQVTCGGARPLNCGS